MTVFDVHSRVRFIAEPLSITRNRLVGGESGPACWARLTEILLESVDTAIALPSRFSSSLGICRASIPGHPSLK